MERKYHFEGLGIHESFIVQKALDMRKENITLAMPTSEKAFKAILEELDQMYADLDHHIADLVREQEYIKEGKRIEQFPQP